MSNPVLNQERIFFSNSSKIFSSHSTKVPHLSGHINMRFPCDEFSRVLVVSCFALTGLSTHSQENVIAPSRKRKVQ